MVQYFPPPDCRSLLPPLLACLPTSFVSPQPPPALLPLLTPILRQRVQLLAATASSPSDSWLPLLCWETEPAQRLVDLIADSDAFELHPVSGEIDFGDVEDIRYRRLDEETLQAVVALPDLGLVITYQWCDGDSEDSQNGWRVSEIRPIEADVENSTEGWYLSVAEAEGKERDYRIAHSGQGENQNLAQEGNNERSRTQGDEADYWALYDRTPGRTPSARVSTPPIASSRHARSTSEADYFARYAQVQPEMENDDPSEDRQSFGDFTVNGDLVTSSTKQLDAVREPQSQEPIALPNGSGVENANGGIMEPSASSPKIGATAVSRLEDSAENQSMTESAITHHVSTSIKSLYRLCRSSGIDRTEFDRMIQSEMDTLGMMEEDD